jgi:anti-sigma B factor antagonist
MRITSAKRDSVTVVFLEGSIDGKTAPVVRDELRPILEKAEDVVLDMSKVDYLSSAGLRLLLLVYREFVAKNKKLVLAGMSQEIEEVMSYTGFLGFFRLAPTNAQAMQMIA